MNGMIMIQFGMLSVIILIAFTLFWSKLWKGSGLFSRSDVLSIIIQLGIMIWAVIFFLIGLTKLVLLSGWDNTNTFLTIGVPLLVITFFLFKICRNYYTTKQELKEIKQATTICKTWAFSFPYVSEDNTHIKLYLKKGKPVGKLIISDVTEEQALELNGNKGSLPKDVLLEVYTIEENSIIH
ncbi:hypothetical protein ASL14_19085 [Paenibacillus sp. IHB B 3084]|uniref:hypothetical protein n=1 Tax=Paenibacillus sp. IHB B 3084 TaxID=867076 RepID=UPI0007200C21|nr:hypothetical protein [Paenibacillus sp. IHB B 3084]ALP37978.1 hypothetical protein ASL14_19085 [Paenibacillus sp. IHB B 3084]